MAELAGQFNKKDWTFDYQDLVKATGLDINVVQQHRSRGKFDPQRIETVVVYLVKHGRKELRREMVEALITRDSAEKKDGTLIPRGPKRKKKPAE